MATISPSPTRWQRTRATPRTALPAIRRRRSARRCAARRLRADWQAPCPSPSRSPCRASRCSPGCTASRRAGGRAARAGGAAGGACLGRQQAETDQHRVERRRVVPLRREEDVARRRPLVEIAQLVEEQPAHDLERAEARADVARPGAGNHVERVDARQRGERCAARRRDAGASAAAETRRPATYCSSSDSP